LHGLKELKVLLKFLARRCLREVLFDFPLVWLRRQGHKRAVTLENDDLLPDLDIGQDLQVIRLG
jgi:hypothetical protein